MLLILITLAMLLLPPLAVGLISTWLLSPKGRVRAGLALAVAGIAAIVLPYLYGTSALQAVRAHPVTATGTTEMSFRTWIGGQQNLSLLVSAPKGVDLRCAMGGARVSESGCPVNIDWVLREGDTIIARGNPAREWTPVDPALLAAAERMAERGRQLRAEQGLPPQPVRPPPQRRDITIGYFSTVFVHRYTLQLTPHFDPRLEVRASVVSGHQKDFAVWFVLGVICGLVWLAVGAGLALAGQLAGRR